MAPETAQQQIEQALALLDLTIGDMLDSAREELDGADPLAGQCWTSALLGLLRTGPDVPFDAAELVVEALGRVVDQTPDDEVALGLVQVLSGLAPTGHAVRTAGEILARSRAAGGPALPRWAEPMQLEPSVSLVTTDGFGDQTGVYVSFQGQSPTDRHVLIALIDHNLRGVVKELFVTDEVDELLEAVRSELGGDEVRQVEPAQALQLVAQALAATDAQPDRKELCGEETASHLPLAWARVRSAGVAAKPGPGSGAGPTEAALVQGTLDVLTGCALDGAAAMAATRFVTALAVDGGLPLRASPVAVLLALFDGVADQPWTDEELDGLQEALPVVTAHINRSSPLAQEIQGGLAEAWEDLWPEARRLLAAGHRLAPGRRGVMDALLGEDDDADGDDDEDYDEDYDDGDDE